MPTTAISTGIYLYYEWHGEADGIPIVFIRGTGADSSRWLPQVEDYKKKYRTLIFDNRGVGKSDAPKGPYSVEMMAEDSVALLDALNVEKCHVSGLSLGAAIGAQIAIAFPERVQTLQLHGGWAKTHGYAKMYLGMLGRWLEEGGLDLYYEAALLYLFPPDFITKNYDQVMTVLDNMKKNSSPIEGMRGQLDANMSHDIADKLNQISVPTLITVGENDMCLPPSFSRELADGIPNSELIIFPGGSHLFGIQDPGTFNRTTLDWLERANRTSS